MQTERREKMIEVPTWGLAMIVGGMFLFGVMCGKGGGE